MKIRSAIILLLVLLLCGCSAAGSVENLLTPPKLTAEQNEIYEVLINSVGQNVKLKYPRSGEYRSAFVLKDIDSEPGMEAMVFYESNNVQSGESSLRLKFLDKNDGRWEAVYDMSCAGSEVDSISFASLGGTGATEIVIRYTMLNQSERAFSVLKYDGVTPTRLYTSSYSCLEVYDLNGDGQDELLSVTTDKITRMSTAMMFTYGDNGFEKLAETSISSDASEYLRVTKGLISENKPALFLDYSKGGGQSGTDVIYCYGNRLYSPESSAQGTPAISRQVNNYMAEIYCFDIDGDGFVEIPSTTPLPGYEMLTKPEQLCAVMWYTVSDDSFVQEQYSYFSGKYRFALFFPNRWRGVVTARTEFATNEIVFISYNEEKGLSGGSELIRIRAVEKDDPEAVAAANELTKLGESDDTLFCLIETNQYKSGALALTESELKNSFVVL